MKKQNVNGKLAFNKKALVELNDDQLMGVNGGGFGSLIVSAIVSAIVSGVISAITGSGVKTQ